MAETSLDQHNNLIYNAVLTALTTEPHKHRAQNDAFIGDFGGMTWCVQWVDGPEFPDTMRLSIQIPGLKSQVGVQEILQERYSDILKPPMDKFDITVEFNVDTPQESPDDFALRVSLLGRTAAGATLYHHFKMLEAAGEKGTMPASAPVKVMSRPGEYYWVINSVDKVIVAASLCFLDEESQVIAGLCLNQGFGNTDKFAASAPTVIFSDTPPADIASEAVTELSGWSVATYFPRHVSGNKMDNTVSQALNWRNTLSYHVKAAKQYTTSKMRHRVEFFQTVLARAVPKKEQGAKSGKELLTAIGDGAKIVLNKAKRGAAGER